MDGMDDAPQGEIAAPGIQAGRVGIDSILLHYSPGDLYTATGPKQRCSSHRWLLSRTCPPRFAWPLRPVMDSQHTQLMYRMIDPELGYNTDKKSSFGIKWLNHYHRWNYKVKPLSATLMQQWWCASQRAAICNDPCCLGFCSQSYHTNTPHTRMKDRLLRWKKLQK